MDQPLAYVDICASDHQMDQTGESDLPLNALPEKCPRCALPDLDHVPSPYLLGKGITKPVELDNAEVGNFFARDRARKVIEAVCPGQCEFYPTFDRKARGPTPWSLAVPTAMVPIGTAKAKIPRCPECGEPKVAHWGSQYDQHPPDSIESDIAKSSGWISDESTLEEAPFFSVERGRWYSVERAGLDSVKIPAQKYPPKSQPHRWTRTSVSRFLYFSVRLDLLLKTLAIKGVVRTAFSTQLATDADRAWVKERISSLTELGLATPPTATDSAKVSRWFRSYLKKHARKQDAPTDFSAVEARIGKPLCVSYKAFISKVGPTTFHNLDEQEYFEANIVGPDDLDTRGYRRGMIQFEDEESARIDGLIFATTRHGDAFCFDLSEGGSDPPVYLYEHEMNCFQAYATNFESCVKRFAGK